MKNYLFKGVRIIDPKSDHHGQTLDIRVVQGEIKEISKEVSPNDSEELIKVAGAIMTPGWFDIGVYSGAPGNEHREDWESLSGAARAGGYTGVAIWPETQPSLDTSVSVRAINSISNAYGLEIVPIASPLIMTERKDLSEILDIHESGCRVFGLGLHSITDDGTMLRCLKYLSQVDAAMIHCPSFPELILGSSLTEGDVSTSMGMQGIPTMEEKARVYRDINFAKYASALLIEHGIHSAETLELLGTAKKETHKLHLGIAAMNLSYSASDMLSFDSNLKVIPPLSKKSEQEKLKEAVLYGTVDYIFSNHQPLEPELKLIEFASADFGAATIDRAFSYLNSAFGNELSDERIYELLCKNPRTIMGQKEGLIAVGEKINATVFNRKEAADASSKSRSNNYPPMKAGMRGRVVWSYC